VRELSVFHGSKLIALYENHGTRLAIQRDELHFERGAALVYVHDDANVSSGELLLGQIRR
jgi:hypothetical protein